MAINRRVPPSIENPDHTVFCIWPSELSLFLLTDTTRLQSVTVSIETINTKHYMYLNSSLSFEKTALTFCLLLLSHYLIVLNITNTYKMICLDSPPLWTSEIKTSYTPSKIQCNLLGPDNQVGHSSPLLDISCNYKKNLRTILQ